MRITDNTPLENLPEYETLSAWAKNVCQNSDIFTLADLMDTPESELQKIRNCGKRTLEELQSIKLKYSTVPVHEDADAVARNNSLVSNPGNLAGTMSCIVAEYGRKLPEDIVPLYDRYMDYFRMSPTEIIKDKHSYVEIVRRFTWDEFNRLKPYLPKLIIEVLTAMNMCGYKFDDVYAIAHEYVDNAACHLAKSMLLSFPTVVTNNLEIEYQLHFSQLPTRTRNVFKDLCTLDGCLPYLCGARPVETYRFPGCGERSYHTFLEFLDKERKFRHEALSGMRSNGSPEYYLESYCRKYMHLYPFLSYSEQAHLGVIEILGKELPAMSIWQKYVNWNSKPTVCMLRDFYGLNSERKCYSVQELSNKYSLTNERVRQITMSGLPEDPVVCMVRDRVAYLFTEPMVGSWDSRWNEINTQNNLNYTPREIMALICMANSDYGVLTTESGVSFMVDRSKFGLIKLRGVLKKIETRFALRRYDNETIELSHFFNTVTKHNLSDDEMKEICDVMSTYLLKRDGVQTNKDNQLVFEHNSLDRSLAIERVLREKGTPMSVAEIFETYNNTHPSEKIDSQSSVHSYLLRNDNVISMGKRGLYALKEWPDIYSGCLKDHIPEVLDRYDRPLTLSELTARVRENFPDTNEKSVSTLIYANPDGLYEVFVGNLVGLAGKNYDDRELKVRKVKRRETFNERMDNFMKFVDEEGRLPYTNSNEEESSLDRWRKNIQCGKVEASESQINVLNKYLEESSDLPQNGQEHIFREKCRMVRKLAEETGRLPHNRENPNLYVWFYKSLKQRGTWHDNRDMYFEDLLEYLKGHLNMTLRQNLNLVDK